MLLWQAKGVITDVTPWKKARKFFYWRLRRRIYEEFLVRKIGEANPDTTYDQRKFMLRRWFFEDRGNQQLYLWDDNEQVPCCSVLYAGSTRKFFYALSLARCIVSFALSLVLCIVSDPMHCVICIGSRSYALSQVICIASAPMCCL